MIYLKRICLISTFLFGFKGLVCSQVDVKSDSVYIDSLVKVIAAKVDSGQLNQAIEFALSTLEKSKQLLGENHPLTADVWQAYGVINTTLGDFHTAKTAYENAIAAKIAWGGLQNTQLAVSYNSLGALHSNFWKLDEAMYYFQKTLEILAPISDKPNSTLPRVYNNLGTVFMGRGNLTEAVLSFQKSIDFFNLYYGVDAVQQVNAYLNMGSAFIEKGDLGQARLYFEQILNILSKNSGVFLDTKALALDGLGSISHLEKDYIKAAQYFNKAYDLMLQYSEGDTLSPNFYTLYNNIGNNHLELKNADLAQFWHQRSIRMLLNNFPDGHPYLLSSYNTLGVIAQAEKHYDEAENLFRKAIDVGNQFYILGNTQLAVPYNQLVTNYELRGNLVAARGLADSALALFPEQSLSVDLMQALFNRGVVEFRLWKSNNPESNIELAASFIDSAMQLRKAIPSQYMDRNVQTQWADLNYSQTSWSLRVLLELFEQTRRSDYFDKAWSYLEQSRSILLSQQLRSNTAITIGTFPDSLAHVENALRSDIYYYELQLQEIGIEGEEAFGVRGKLKKAREQLSLTREYIRQKYPNVFAMRYGESYILPMQCQTSMASDEMMLNYFVHDSLSFLLWIKKDTFGYTPIPEGKSFDSLIVKLQKGLTGYYKLPKKSRTTVQYKESLVAYSEAAYQLYCLLIKPVEQLLVNKLIILPDGKLSNIPFEALLRKKPGNLERLQHYPYLARDYNLHYGYSATSLEMMYKKHPDEPAAGEWLAFVPFFSGDTTQISEAIARQANSQTDTLWYSALEVLYLKNFFKNSQIFFGDTATLERFISLAPYYKILHMATHGKAIDWNGDFCFLFFHGSNSLEEEGRARLYARDIYSLQLNANMVVLSACETGIGELRRGEGMISLSRAFAWAGAKSVITTLWQVNDETSKGLVISFYQHLKNRAPKDTALTEAKRQYFQQSFGEAAHPYFWAGYIAIGDPAPIW